MLTTVRGPNWKKIVGQNERTLKQHMSTKRSDWHPLQLSRPQQLTFPGTGDRKGITKYTKLQTGERRFVD
jgi:hypothetical protein